MTEKFEENRYMVDQLSRRMDNHGAKIDAKFSELDQKLERKFGLIFSKLDDNKDKMVEEDGELSQRIGKLESERGLVGKAINLFVALFGGALSGWLAKHWGA